MLLWRRHRLIPLVAALVAMVAACGAPATAPTATPAAPSATETQTEDPSEGLPAEGAPDECTPPDLCAGVLSPGEYTTDSFGPTVSFTVGEGWRAGQDLEEVGFFLEREDAGGHHALTVTHFDGEVFVEACSPEPTEDIARSAEVFVEWLRHREGIEAEEPTETQLGGHPAVQVDLTTSLPEGCTAPEWIWLWVLPQVGDFHFNDDEQARVIAADVGETTAVVVIEALPGVDYDAFLETSMDVVESIAIEP